MNPTPVELYHLLFGVIPLGFCFGQWKYQWRGWTTALLCACASWLYFQLWMVRFDPPDHGLTVLVYFVTGWFWMLPLLGLLMLAFRWLDPRLSASKRAKMARLGFRCCVVSVVLIVAWNFCGRMSATRAVREARRELKEHGYQPHGREEPFYRRGYWVVRYPETEFGEIGLSRNGKTAWIGQG